MTDTGDDRYQTCKVYGAKDCDCTMADWVEKLQSENANISEQLDLANQKLVCVESNSSLDTNLIYDLQDQLSTAQSKVGVLVGGFDDLIVSCIASRDCGYKTLSVDHVQYICESAKLNVLRAK